MSYGVVLVRVRIRVGTALTSRFKRMIYPRPPPPPAPETLRDAILVCRLPLSDNPLLGRFHRPRPLLIIRRKRTVGAHPVNLRSLPWTTESTHTDYDKRVDESSLLVPLPGKTEKALTSLLISEPMPLEPQRRASLTRHMNSQWPVASASTL